MSRIQGISSCRISADETGEITEVHVVSTGHKSPKLVARDVESCLKAELGISVDYKKIGVVVVDASSPRQIPIADSAPAATREGVVAEFPVEEYSSRFEYQSVNVFMSQDSVQAEVELRRDGVETFGTAKSENPRASHMHVVAEATLKAVLELLDAKIRLWLADVAEIALGDEVAVVARVTMLKGRDRQDLAGCALYSGNTNQTVVFATLDAVNRVVGALKPKRSVQYEIE